MPKAARKGNFSNSRGMRGTAAWCENPGCGAPSRAFRTNSPPDARARTRARTSAGRNGQQRVSGRGGRRGGRAAAPRRVIAASSACSRSRRSCAARMRSSRRARHAATSSSTSRVGVTTGGPPCSCLRASITRLLKSSRCSRTARSEPRASSLSCSFSFSVRRVRAGGPSPVRRSRSILRRIHQSGSCVPVRCVSGLPAPGRLSKSPRRIACCDRVLHIVRALVHARLTGGVRLVGRRAVGLLTALGDQPVDAIPSGLDPGVALFVPLRHASSLGRRCAEVNRSGERRRPGQEEGTAPDSGAAGRVGYATDRAAERGPGPTFEILRRRFGRAQYPSGHY